MVAKRSIKLQCVITHGTVSFACQVNAVFCAHTRRGIGLVVKRSINLQCVCACAKSVAQHTTRHDHRNGAAVLWYAVIITRNTAEIFH